LRFVAAVATLILCGACKVDVSVGIDARADGTGEVRATALLDRQAVQAIGDLDTQLKFDDLVASGWDIERTKQDGGRAQVVARHGFASPAGARRLIEDLGGVGGPFKGFAIEQRRGLLKTHTTLRGTVDLQAGLASFSDAKLTESLGGQPLGVTDAQLEQRAGAPLNQVFGLQVAARLPGRVATNAATATGDGGVWAPKFGEQVALQATAEQWNVTNIALLTIAAGSGAALLGALAQRIRRRGVNLVQGERRP
jgi:hypothetical protein